MNEDEKEELVYDYNTSSLPNLTSVSSQILLADSLILTSRAQHSHLFIPENEENRVNPDRPLSKNKGIVNNAPSNQDLVTPTPLHINNYSGKPYCTLFEEPEISYGLPLWKHSNVGLPRQQQSKKTFREEYSNSEDEKVLKALSGSDNSY